MREREGDGGSNGGRWKGVETSRKGWYGMEREGKREASIPVAESDSIMSKLLRIVMIHPAPPRKPPGTLLLNRRRFLPRKTLQLRYLQRLIFGG